MASEAPLLEEDGALNNTEGNNVGTLNYHTTRSDSSTARQRSVESIVQNGYRIFGCHLSGDSVVFLTCFVLFLTITVCQYIAAEIANSVTLKADCASMLVDALSYLGNLFAECTPNQKRKLKLELSMSGLSIILLLGFTAFFIFEGYSNINDDQAEICDALSGDEISCAAEDGCEWSDGHCDMEDEVNAWIVLGFALGGLAFDLASIGAYCMWARKKSAGEADDKTPLSGLVEDGKSDCVEENKEVSGAKEPISVNMMSAMAHVFSDLLRSIATLLMSLVILTDDNVNGERADGWSALVVCCIIAVGAAYAVYEWVVAYRGRTSTE